MILFALWSFELRKCISTAQLRVYNADAHQSECVCFIKVIFLQKL